MAAPALDLLLADRRPGLAHGGPRRRRPRQPPRGDGRAGTVPSAGRTGRRGPASASGRPAATMADDTPATPTPDDDPLRWEAENRLRAGRFGLIAGVCTLVGSIVTLRGERGRAPRRGARPHARRHAQPRRERAARPAGPGRGDLRLPGRPLDRADPRHDPRRDRDGRDVPAAGVPLARDPGRPLPRGTVPRFALITTAVGAVAAGVGLTVSGVALWIRAHDFVSAADQSNSVAADARTGPGRHRGRVHRRDRPARARGRVPAHLPARPARRPAGPVHGRRRHVRRARRSSSASSTRRASSARSG